MNKNKINGVLKTLKPKLDAKSRPVPPKLQPILWSVDIKNLDFEDDKIYIIHQVLSYGSLEDIKLIFKIYARDEILDVFINNPKKVYTKPIFLFIKDFLLKINTELDFRKYVKNIVGSAQR
jgi:hypothetical protein